MDQINVISFPRSGQHLLQSILEYVYNEHNMKYSFCEFYRCCHKTPCKYGYIFQKNHDFNNKIQITNNKHIILYRKDIILQLESYYRYHISVYNKPYNFNNLIKFIKNKSEYYNKFVKKWTTNIDNTNIFVIEYYDLINNPVDIIYKLFTFLNPNIQINKEIIDNIINIKFTIKNDKCINNNTSHKITELNKMNPNMYNRIKVLLSQK
jgi:hypothetical protein